MKQSLSAIALTAAALSAQAQSQPNEIDVPFDSGYVSAVQSGQYGPGVGAGIVLGDTQRAVGLSLTHLQKADHFNMSWAAKVIPGVLGTAGLRLTRADASAVFGNDILDKKVTAGEGSVGLKLEGVGRLNSFSVTGVRQKGHSKSDIGGSVDFSEVTRIEDFSGGRNFYSDVYEHNTQYSATGKTQDGVRIGLNLDIGKFANLLAGYQKTGKQRILSMGPEIYGDGWNLTALVSQTKVKGQETKAENDITTSLSGTVRISPTAQLAARVVLDKKAKVQNAFVGLNIVTDPIGVTGKPTSTQQMGADYSVRNTLGQNLENIRPLYDLNTTYKTTLVSSTVIGTEYDPKPEVEKPVPPVTTPETPPEVPPGAPNCTADDTSNTINCNGIDPATLEVAFGGSWVPFVAATVYDGDRTVYVRIKATATTPASPITTLNFTETVWAPPALPATLPAINVGDGAGGSVVFSVVMPSNLVDQNNNPIQFNLDGLPNIDAAGTPVSWTISQNGTTINVSSTQFQGMPPATTIQTYPLVVTPVGNSANGSTSISLRIETN